MKTQSALRLAAAMLGGLLALIGGTWLAGCRAFGGSAQDGELVVWVSGDTRGYLEPCGCRRDQAGGLAARMTLVARDNAPARLLLDVGNVTSGGRSYELLKFDYLQRGMAAMGYDAVNLGRREAGLDRDTLRQNIRNSRLPFVSCNVLDRQSGKPLAAPSTVKTVGGMRVGITGVVQAEAEEVGPGLTVRPPEEALSELLPDLKARCDFVIVLAFAPYDTLRRIASRFPEAGAVLGGDVPQSSERAESVNRAALFCVTDHGKVIGRLAFRRSEDNGMALVDSRAVKTADTIPPAPAMTALLREYRSALRDRNLALAAQEGFDPISAQEATADAYAGQARCRPCHAGAHRIALATPHPHAYATLAKKGSEYDPECLRCHVVGYGARDGFVNLPKTPQLAGVQCESCHGRGMAHILAVQAGKTGHAATAALRAVTPNSCIQCHDAENSADFRYAVFWPRIRH